MVYIESDKDSHTREIKLGREICTYNNMAVWIAKAPTWAGHRNEKNIISIDSIGRICLNGGDFQRAEDEDTFPITVYEKRV